MIPIISGLLLDSLLILESHLQINPKSEPSIPIILMCLDL